MLQAQTGARQPIGKGKGKKGKGKGKGGGTPAMPMANSATFEELLEAMPQDTCPYLVTELWTAAGCPSSEVGVIAGMPAQEVTEEWFEPTGYNRWTGEPLICHRGDECARVRCVFHHSWGQTNVDDHADYSGGGAEGLHAMIAQLKLPRR